MRARRTTLLGAALVAMTLLVTGLAAPASASTTADVTGLSTHVASAHGYTIIHVYGNHLATAKQVRFGPYLAGHLVVHSDHDLSVLVPVTDRDLTTHIAVYTATAGRSSWSDPQALFTFIRPPAISAVTPNTGSAQGGRRSTITGTDLIGVRAVLVGGAYATALNSVTPTRLDFTAPPHPAGVVVVQVITWYGASTQAIHYRYLPAPVVSRLWHPMGPAGGNQLEIDGSGLALVTAVTLGGESAPIIGTQTDSALLVSVPTHAAGTVPVRVSGPNGTNVPSISALYTYTTANTESWSPSVEVDPAQGYMQSISCPTATFCSAVDEHDLYVWTDGAWSAPTRETDSDLVGVSCASATFCLTAGNRSVGKVWDGRTWSTLSAPARIDRIACPADGFCFGTDSVHVYRYDGSWSQVNDLPGSVNISCPASTFCMATSRAAGAAWTYDGTNWTPQATSPAAGSTRLSCGSSTLCATVGIDGFAQTWDGHAWTTSTTSGGWVSCRTGVCTTVSGGTYSRFANGVWSAPAAMPSRFVANALDCATATSCLAVDGYGHVSVYDPSGWSAPAPDFATAAPFTSISCPSTQWCAASDLDGDVLTYDGTGWGTPQRVLDDYGHHTSISCSSSTFCVLVGSDQAASFDGTSWHTQLLPQSTTGPISCADGNCFTPDYRYDGHGWTDAAIPLVASDVSCVTANYCVAVGGGSSSTWNGRNWTSPTASNAGGSVSCWSVGNCVSVGDGSGSSTAGAVSKLAGTTWQVSAVSESGDIACSSANFCVLLTARGARTFDGHLYSDPANLYADVQDRGHVACPADGMCFALTQSAVWQARRTP